MLLDREAVIAVDSEPDCIQRLKERYPDRSNLHAFACDAGSAAFFDLARFRPDCCVCLNALEHIEDDRQALHGMASILGPGGVVVLLVPAFPMLYGPIDSNLATTGGIAAGPSTGWPTPPACASGRRTT